VLDVSFRHPIKLIANALGVPPKAMIDKGRKHGVPVAALVGSKEHALRQVAAGVDILVAQGTEAGGHCGEVSTMVLVPEVIKAIKPICDVPVLAAGGIMTGRQMAACMAMGAAGAWTGSVWLATVESETTEIFREKMIAASSRDAIRSKGRTGKPRGNCVRCGPTRGTAGRTVPARCRCRCKASSAATPSTRSTAPPPPATHRRAIS
jgi:NAD(P)H-dependent flavin oxidoreductase YrpB (nitropropane dioxygenase family)